MAPVDQTRSSNWRNCARRAVKLNLHAPVVTFTAMSLGLHVMTTTSCSYCDLPGPPRSSLADCTSPFAIIPLVLSTREAAASATTKKCSWQDLMEHWSRWQLSGCESLIDPTLACGPKLQINALPALSRGKWEMDSAERVQIGSTKWLMHERGREETSASSLPSALAIESLFWSQAGGCL